MQDLSEILTALKACSPSEVVLWKEAASIAAGKAWGPNGEQAMRDEMRGIEEAPWRAQCRRVIAGVSEDERKALVAANVTVVTREAAEVLAELGAPGVEAVTIYEQIASGVSGDPDAAKAESIRIAANPWGARTGSPGEENVVGISHQVFEELKAKHAKVGPRSIR